MIESGAGKKISTILRHDNKQTSYKIALLRAINDVVLSYPDIGVGDRNIAIPLRLLAEFWVAYYWPFVDPATPILQGHRFRRQGGLTSDIAFRPELTRLREEWQALTIDAGRPSDGFFLVNELQLVRKWEEYPASLRRTYLQAVRSIARIIEKHPVRYAGPGEWAVFERPRCYRELPGNTLAVPGTDENEVCLVIDVELWRTFLSLSLWVEALCIHEWCLFTETVEQEVGQVDRGTVYTLLTARPDNRRPLTWERNRIDILFLEGYSFTCPWTGMRLAEDHYELDHIVPVAVYPINEIWNLVPAEPAANLAKRDRLPSAVRLSTARPHLINSYDTYQWQPDLHIALQQDVQRRFSRVMSDAFTSANVVEAVSTFVEQLAEARNLARY